MAVDDVGMARGDGEVFREGAVAFRAEKPRAFKRFAARFGEAGFDQNALPDKRGVRAWADGGDPARAVDPRNMREDQGLARPGGVRGIAFAAGLPRQPGVDIGVVYGACTDADQNLARTGFRAGQIGAPFQALGSAVAREDNAGHFAV